MGTKPRKRDRNTTGPETYAGWYDAVYIPQGAAVAGNGSDGSGKFKSVLEFLAVGQLPIASIRGSRKGGVRNQQPNGRARFSAYLPTQATEAPVFPIQQELHSQEESRAKLKTID